MKNLLVTLCVLIVIGVAWSAAHYVRLERARKLLQSQLAAANTRASDLRGKLAQASRENDALGKRLVALDSDLGEAKSRFTTVEAHNFQLGRELAQSKALVATHEQNERNLSNQVAALLRDLADARAAAVSPETVESYKNTIAELERLLANAQNGAAAPAVAGASTAVFASHPREAGWAAPEPAPVTATVLNVGPESAFVVLNCGSTQGVEVGRHFSVQRGTVELATVLISDARTNFSIAQVQPDTLHGALRIGDSALSIH